MKWLDQGWKGRDMTLDIISGIKWVIEYLKKWVIEYLKKEEEKIKQIEDKKALDRYYEENLKSCDQISRWRLLKNGRVLAKVYLLKAEIIINFFESYSSKEKAEEAVTLCELSKEKCNKCNELKTIIKAEFLKAKAFFKCYGDKKNARQQLQSIIDEFEKCKDKEEVNELFLKVEYELKEIDYVLACEEDDNDEKKRKLEELSKNACNPKVAVLACFSLIEMLEKNGEYVGNRYNEYYNKISNLEVEDRDIRLLEVWFKLGKHFARKANNNGEHNVCEKAIKCCDEVIKKGENSNAYYKESVCLKYYLEGTKWEESRDDKKAIKAYEKVIQKFNECPEDFLIEYVIKAYIGTGDVYCKISKSKISKEGISSYLKVVKEFRWVENLGCLVEQCMSKIGKAYGKGVSRSLEKD